MNETRRTALIGGVILIVLGLVFLLDNFNIVPGSITDWWPVVIIGAGLWLLAQAFRRGRHGGLVGGALLLGLGGYWLLDNLGRINADLFLPVLLISLGVGLLLRVFVRER